MKFDMGELETQHGEVNSVPREYGFKSQSASSASMGKAIFEKISAKEAKQQLNTEPPLVTEVLEAIEDTSSLRSARLDW